MDQWRHLEELQKSNGQQVLEQLNAIYQDCPILCKIRTLFPDFVENVNRLPCENETTAQQWMSNILSSVAECLTFTQQLEVQHLKTAMKDRYGGCGLNLVQDMRQCLEKERELIEFILRQDNQRQQLPQDLTTVAIKSEIEHIGKTQSVILEKGDAFVKCQKSYDLTTHGDWLDGANIQQRDGDCARQLYVLKQETANLLEEMVNQMGSLCPHIWDRVDKWARSMHLHLHDLAERTERSIKDLSELCDMAGKLFCDACKLTDKICEQLCSENDEDIAEKVTRTEQTLQQLVKKHISKVIIVHQPPPTIIKVGSGNPKQGPYFSMGVCLLGAVGLGLDDTSLEVSAELYKEKDLEGALAGDSVTSVCQVKTSPRDTTIKLGDSAMTGGLVADFNKVSLDKVRLEGRGRGVGYLMYFLVFHCKVSVLGQTFTVQVSAPPMSLVSHHGYDCDALGRLVWNAAFPLENGKPFEDRQKVAWKEVAQMLNHIFHVKAGKELNQQQLTYLGHIAFKMHKKRHEISEKLISRNQLLIKTCLYGNTDEETSEFCVQFSFWKWFSSCLNLLKGPLKQEWDDGLIYGFVGKHDAKDLLWGKADGTFLLRFCETTIEKSTKADNCGCLSVAVITTCDTRDVFFVKDHLAQKSIMADGESLARVLMSLDRHCDSGKNPRLLHYLYPDKPFPTHHEVSDTGCVTPVKSPYVRAQPVRRPIQLTHSSSKSKIRAVGGVSTHPTPTTRLSLVVVTTDPHTGTKTHTAIKNNLTHQQLQDIQQVVRSFDAMTIAGQTQDQPKALKRPLKDPTECLPQDAPSDGERSIKQGRSNILAHLTAYSSTVTSPVSQMSSSSSSEDLSPGSPSLMQLPSNTVPPVEEDAELEMYPDFLDLVQNDPELSSIEQDKLPWELPPPLDAAQD